jgi:hypothetical protein
MRKRRPVFVLRVDGTRCARGSYLAIFSMVVVDALSNLQETGRFNAAEPLSAVLLGALPHDRPWDVGR